MAKIKYPNLNYKGQTEDPILKQNREFKKTERAKKAQQVQKEFDLWRKVDKLQGL